MSEDQNLEPEGEEAVEGPDLSWVPEKFRENPQAFGEAYTNLERAYHQSRQEVKGLEESIQSLSTQFEEFTAAQSRPDPNTVYSQWQDLYDQDPVGTMAQIAQATANQILAQQAQKPAGPDPDLVARVVDYSMGQKHEDWAQYREKVAERISQDPVYQRDDLWGNPDAAERALTSVFNVVKAEDVLAGNSLVEQQQADTRAMKLGAQSAAGASGRSTAPPEDEWSQVMKFREKKYYD
jgi:cell division septum initiation protein DivIVA